MLKKIVWILGLVGMVATSQAQTKLGDAVADAGLEWMAGDWQAETDSGDTVFISFKPDLDNHIGLIHFKDRRSESKGIVLFDPTSEEAKYYSGNNRGDIGTGVWTAQDKKAVLKYKHSAVNGNTTRMALVFSKINAEIMGLKVYELSENGEMGDESRLAVEFKRKK